MNELVDTFANRLNTAIKARNIKPIELSEKTGIDKSKISSYMSGRYKAKQDGVYLLAKVLNVSEAWLMGLDVPMEKKEYITAEEWSNNKKYVATKNSDGSISYSIPLTELYKDQVPLLGTIKAGYDYLAHENVIDYISINFKKEDYDYYALKIVGDSMETIMSDGDYVVIQKQNEFNSGDYCVVLINGEEATVKRVYKLENGIDLVALNPAYKHVQYSFEDMEKIPVQVIGIVKQLIKNFN